MLISDKVRVIKKEKIILNMEKRSIPVCFTNDQYKLIQKYAEKNGMLNASQALESLLKEI